MEPRHCGGSRAWDRGGNRERLGPAAWAQEEGGMVGGGRGGGISAGIVAAVARRTAQRAIADWERKINAFVLLFLDRL
jgi:hypothetical protein